MNATTLTLNGVELDVVRTGQGRALLYLHPHVGRGSSSDFIAALSRQFDVIAPSHPGFDHSKVNGDFDSVDDLAYFYLDLLEKLELEDVIVVGSSFGGWIALAMAVKSVSRIGNVVLIGSVGVRFGGPTGDEIADVFSMSDEAFAAKAYADARFAPPARDALNDAEMLTHATNREASARYGWLPCLYDPKLRQRLHRVSPPTLVLSGAADAITAPAYGRQIASALPRATFEEVAGAGHFPHIEQSDAVAARIAAHVA